MTHKAARSPAVRRATQAMARSIPAAVEGNCSVAIGSPVAETRMAMVWLRAWVSTPMTNGWACATMVTASGLPSRHNGQGSGRRNGRRRPGWKSLRGSTVKSHDSAATRGRAVF